MAEGTSATNFRVVQSPVKKLPKSDAERAKAYRQRKRAEAEAPPSADHLIPPDFVPPAEAGPEPVVATKYIEDPRPLPGSSRPPSRQAGRRSPRSPSWSPPSALPASASRKTDGSPGPLGADVTAGWLFLAVGVASDLAALVLPAVCARAWAAKQRGAALAGWAVWMVAFAFAVTASIGFTALNVSAVTASRAERVTLAVTVAQTALGDARAARTRECASGTGKVCRTRETTVVERQAALDAAMLSVQANADPQASAAVGMVEWVTRGAIRPGADDFNQLRLILLVLLPQLGGVLLMFARTA